MRIAILSLLLATISGCSASGPATTDTTSCSLPTLERKIEFLERYVTFRRNYEELEFHIKYFNGGSGVPSPSEWDVRLVARLAPDEVDRWIPANVAPVAEADASWLATVPRREIAAGISEWYVEGRRVTGVDKSRGVVAYRLLRY